MLPITLLNVLHLLGPEDILVIGEALFKSFNYLILGLFLDQHIKDELDIFIRVTTAAAHVDSARLNKLARVRTEYGRPEHMDRPGAFKVMDIISGLGSEWNFARGIHTETKKQRAAAGVFSRSFEALDLVLLDKSFVTCSSTKEDCPYD